MGIGVLVGEVLSFAGMVGSTLFFVAIMYGIFCALGGCVFLLFFYNVDKKPRGWDSDKLRRFEPATRCIVCHDKQPTTTTMPCGHILYCSACFVAQLSQWNDSGRITSETCGECPYCRAPIQRAHARPIQDSKPFIASKPCVCLKNAPKTIIKYRDKICK